VRRFSPVLSPYVKAFFAACGLKYAGEHLVDGVDHRGDMERRFPVVEKRLLELLSYFE